MAIKMNTPYGYFPSFKACYEHIEKYDAVNFIIKHQQYAPKYQKFNASHGNGTNNASRHFIWSVIKRELWLKDPAWY